MRSQLCVKSLLLPNEHQTTPYYCNTTEINGRRGILEHKFGIDTHFTATFFTLCCKNASGSVLVWERFTFHILREFWKFGSVWRKRCFPLPLWHVGARGEAELRHLQLKAVSERQECSWNHTQGSVRSERPAQWSQWKNYNWLQEGLNGLCEESSTKIKIKGQGEKGWV